VAAEEVNERIEIRTAVPLTGGGSRRALPARSLARTADDQTIAEVSVVLTAQMTEALLPAAGVEVAPRSADAGVHDGEWKLREPGYRVAHGWIEIALGPAPERAEGSIAAVVRHGKDLDLLLAEGLGDLPQGGEAWHIEVDQLFGGAIPYILSLR